MRQRAAYESHVMQAGKTCVGDELPAAANWPLVFLPRQAGADSLFT